MRLILSLLLIISAQVFLSVETRAQSQAPSCPSVRIEYNVKNPSGVGNSDYGTRPGAETTFTAIVSGGVSMEEPKFNWTLTDGKIISGQGTPAITVDTTGVNSDDANATVEVEGFPPGCDKSASYKFSVIICGLVRADKVYDYGDISWKDEGERLDILAIELAQTSSSRGYIIIYGPRRVDQRLARVRNYLVVRRGVDPNRFILMNGGYNKKVRTELWVAPPGADPPKPDPNF